VSGRKGGWTTDADSKLKGAVHTRGAPGRTNVWCDADSKLKGAVHTRGAKDWVAVARLVPGRTNVWCGFRWRRSMSHSIDPVAGRTGKLTEGRVIN
jgi:hypothetical protein